MPFKLPADSAPRSFVYGDLYSPWKDGLADSSNLYKEFFDAIFACWNACFAARDTPSDVISGVP